VLLVLLIIFMIAGSALAPTGLSLSGLATTESTKSLSPEREVLTVEIDTGGVTRLLYLGETLTWLQLEDLPPSTQVSLSIQATTPAEEVVITYDRLLELGFKEIEWAPPRVNDET
jgi:biopolymer transport protein ExbD